MGSTGRVGLQRRVVCVAILSAVVGCGGGSSAPTRPTTSSVPAGPPAWTLKGSVTETLNGTPIEGAELTFTLSGARNLSATTAAAGEWQISNSSYEGTIDVTAGAPGYVSRQLHLSAPTFARDIVIDLIKDTAPFSLSYYRQPVRNQFDEPDKSQPIRRWKRNPKLLHQPA